MFVYMYIHLHVLYLSSVFFLAGTRLEKTVIDKPCACSVAVTPYFAKVQSRFRSHFLRLKLEACGIPVFHGTESDEEEKVFVIWYQIIPS